MNQFSSNPNSASRIKKKTKKIINLETEQAMLKLCTYNALKHRPHFPRGHPVSEGSRVYVEGLLNAHIIVGINLKITALLT